jgi:hypothetical protein
VKSDPGPVRQTILQVIAPVTRANRLIEFTEFPGKSRLLSHSESSVKTLFFILKWLPNSCG